MSDVIIIMGLRLNNYSNTIWVLNITFVFYLSHTFHYCVNVNVDAKTANAKRLAVSIILCYHIINVIKS